MHALRMSEVKVQREIARYFLLKLRVQRIDARVRVILAEDAHRCAEGNSARRQHGLYTRPGRRSGCGAEAGRSKGGVTEDTELLDAVVSDRADLGQHVLPPIENAIARAHYRFAVLRQVPRKTEARLELFLRAVQSAIRRKTWIGQQRAVSCLSGRNNRLGKDLCFPSQTIIQSEVGSHVPTILSEQRQVFILDGGFAGRRHAGNPGRNSVLQIQKQRPAKAAVRRTENAAARGARLTKWSTLSYPPGERARGVVKAFGHCRSKTSRGRR